MRKAFRGRDVDLLRVADPLQALVTGEARLAVAGAPSFYQLGDDVFPQPRGGAEAVGVVGFDLAHLIVRRDGGPGSLTDVERLAVGEAGGESERTAEMVLTSLGLIDQIDLVTFAPNDEDALAGSIEALEDGDVDALFVMAAQGHPRIASLLAEGGSTLRGVPEWQEEGNNLVRFPFLRVARIADGTYEGMSAPVDTIGAQVVLAGPVAGGDPIGTAGPGSSAVGEILPLAEPTIVELNDQLAAGESLDPTIPSASILRPQPKPAPEAINPSPASSITNLIVILVMIYLISLYFRRGPVRRRQAAKDAAEEHRAA